ncbi:MAG TPA: M56 family metallopeptidase [Prosthecobacter sp.]
MNTIIDNILRELIRHEGLALLVSAALTSAGIVCVAAAAAAVLRHRSARARSLVWRLAMVALVIVGGWKLMPDVSPPPVAVVEWQVDWSALPAPAATAFEPIVLPEPTLWERVMDGVDGWAVRVWLGVAGLWMLARIMGVCLGLRSLGRRGDEAPPALRRIGGGSGLPTGTRYHLVERLGSPMLTGWRKPVIWLPAEAEMWDEARLQAVLRHEAAHWRRKDWLWQWLAQAAVCLWWWQPLAWLARWQLRMETEHAADDMAVADSEQAADYARTLVEIAAGLPGRPKAALGVTMLGRDGVKHRVHALMRANQWRGRIGLGALVALAVVAVALSVLVATKVEFVPQKPMYRSTARLVAGGGHLQGTEWREQAQDFYGTIIETLESSEMKRRALERVKALQPKLETGDVEIRVAQSKGSGIFSVLATGEDAKFTRVFLDALLDEHLAFRQSIREQTQGKAVSTFLQETVKQRKVMEDKLKELGEFQKKNGPLPGIASSRVVTEQLLALSRQKQELSGQLTEIRLEAADIPAYIAEAEAHATAAQPLTAAQAEYLKAANEHRTQANKLQNMLRTLKPEHPDVEVAKAKADLAKAALELAEDTLRKHLQLRQARLERQLTQILVKMQSEEEQEIERSTATVQWEQLKVEAETARQAYDKMMAGAEGLQKTALTHSDYVAIMERASAAMMLPQARMLPVWKLWRREEGGTSKTAAR